MVNEAQLDLESVKGDVRTSAPAFSKAQLIEDALASMEQYLGSVVKEYEKHRHVVEEHSAGVQLAQLTELSDFLAKPDPGNKFKACVIDPYHNVQYAIRMDLLHPRLPVTPNLR